MYVKPFFPSLSLLNDNNVKLRKNIPKIINSKKSPAPINCKVNGFNKIKNDETLLDNNDFVNLAVNV